MVKNILLTLGRQNGPNRITIFIGLLVSFSKMKQRWFIDGMIE